MPDLAFERTLLHTLAEHIPHRIYAKDIEGRFMFANQAVAHGMGAACPEDLIGKTDFGFYPQASAEKYFAQEQAIMRSGQPMLNMEEHVHYSLSDQDAWMLTTKVPLRDDAGQIIGIVGINFDITERKLAELALRDAKRQAEAASLAKSEFLATMSHELRTPLNAVLGYAQVLRGDHGLSEHQRASLKTIERSGEHLLLLVNDVLDMAKIEFGHFELHPVAVHLPDFIQAVSDIVRVKAAEKSLHFVCELDPGLPPIVRVDGRRLSQVLLNLLGNAVKFTDAGTVSLRVRCVSMAASQATVRFEVEDTGPGMRRDEMERIFRRFEQVGEAHRRGDGTGLGLAISRELIEAMQSRIEVRSEPGIGSVFSFELVLGAETVPSAASDIQASRPADNRPLVAPPDEEMKTLHALAKAGNMRDIGRFADHLMTLGDPYRSFAERLHTLAGGYESKAILELAQRFAREPTPG